ncbi:MAG: HEPN family nuclease [Paludibacteraceae bacterium]|nr:HEPN family nuclease [Paludibacteraceae bacterium]
MSYNNFELDFVERTMRNLQEIEEYSKNIYEFTNLLNQCFGLLIVPEEFAKRRGLISNMNKHLNHYGFKKEQLLRFDADKLTISNLLRHLRNGLAHGRIEVLDYDNDTIAGVKIWDTCSSKKNVPYKDIHTIIVFSVEELKTFAINVAKEYCKLKKEELEQAIN